MYKRKVITVTLGIILLSAYAVYWLRIGGSSYVQLRNALYNLTPLCAVIAGLYSLFSYGLKGSRSRTLLLLTLGVFCWCIGEYLFDYYADVLHVSPFPSIADYFYVAAYPLLFLGLTNEIQHADINWSRIKKQYIFLLSILTLLLIGMVSYFGIYLAYDAKEPFFANIIAMGYGVGDLLLIVVNMLLLIVAWEFKGGKLAKVWLYVFAGFVFTLIADILFAMYTTQYKQEVFFYKNLFDSIWMAGYILLAYAFFEIGFIAEDVQHKIRTLGKKKRMS